MRWYFRIEHVAGAKNFGPDALSRYPAQVGGVLSATAYLGGGFPQDSMWSDDVEEAVRGLVPVQQRCQSSVVGPSQVGSDL